MRKNSKAEQLHRLLDGFGRVGVAFSGGADSSFLLRTALDVLGPENVVSLHARSCLQKKAEQERVDSWPDRYGYQPAIIQQRIIDLRPLDWKEFTDNSENRCYLCKKRVYKILLQELAQDGISILLDGTNSDDLCLGEAGRPGLRAIDELGVCTPLADCGLHKTEIRKLSRDLLLDTWNLPSSSCLATRIPHGMKITAKRLEKVDAIEKIIADLGFEGCRIRLDSGSEKTVFLQLLQRDMAQFDNKLTGQTVVGLLKSRGISKIYLDLDGR
jgi:uncharacterized protein